MSSCACAPGPVATRGAAGVANRLIGNHIPENRQSACNSVIAPVRFSWAIRNDQLLDLAANPRSTRIATGLAAIEFTGDKLAVPGQDRVRSRHSRDLGKGLAAQPMADLAEGGALGRPRASVVRSVWIFRMRFSGQIFGPRQQLLVYRSGHVGQDARPLHNSPLDPTVRDGGH